MNDQESIDLKNANQLIEKLRLELAEVQNQYNEPIAIIGIAMRLPGKIKNADDLWNVLFNGIDCIEDIPANRWDKEAMYDPDPNTPGKLYVKQGGFIEDIEMLDGSFFNISPVELESTDTQQRILLEVTHEAFENAGIDVSTLIGSNTGVFIGIDNVDYEAKEIRSKDYERINGYCYTGTGPTGASGRISYTMGLRGPCMTIDTACSSALTCTHVASNALRNKDCDIAVVGGASIISEPDQSLNFCRLNALSPEARCKSFDDEANGYIRSEGVCVMIIKRLSDAQKNQDNILAIIKGSAINQDGKSKRFTAPSTVAQGMLHTQVLKNAGLNPQDISYIEAHGTGTKVGDPAEVRGMMFAYQDYRTKENPIITGAIKSNIGHMECNAGMASIFKVVLALQHNLIPKSIHFNKPNTLIDWENIPLIVAKENMPWPQKTRWASISGFGVTGSNANIIIGDAPENPFKKNKSELRKDIFMLSLSAKSEQAVIELAKKYRDFIQTSSSSLEDICAMAALRRAHFPMREAFLAKDKIEMLEQLQHFVVNDDYESKKIVDDEDEIKTVFVFPGQGAQWIQMGKTLMQQEVVYKAALDEINAVYKNYVSWDLIEEINKAEEDSNLHQIDIVQPVLVAVEIALANLWMSKGVFPDIVVGHSMGEVAAAYVAGNISLHEAAQIIIIRSQLMKQQSGKGEMGVTDLTVEEANELLKGYEDKLSIAVMNSKNSTVLSGDPDALNEIFTLLESKERFNRKVKVDVASHSPQMDGIKSALQTALQHLEPKPSSLIFYSSVLNDIAEGNKLDAEYWSNNLRNPVQFGNVIQKIAKEYNAVYIEMSPHPTLLHALEENLQDSKTKSLIVGSFAKEKNELETFYSNYTSLYTSGISTFSWKNIYPSIGEFVQLPNYAWQKEKYWIETVPLSANYSATAQHKDIDDNFYEIIWKEIIPENTFTTNKKILIIKDTFGYYQNIENDLKQKGCEVQSIDFKDDFSALDADIVLHLRSLYKESVYSYNYDCGIDSLQRLLNRFSGKKQIKICMVTNGAFVIEKDVSANLNASLLTGLLRTVQNEYPDISFQQIDISNEIVDSEMLQLSSMIFVNENYKELAIRAEKCFANQVASVKYSKPTNMILPDVTYVVSGGNNGLGLETVKWLSNKGAKHIAIISRSGLKENAQSEINTLIEQGINVVSYEADVSNLKQLTTAIENIKSTQNEIKGVFHAAGVLDDGMFNNLTQAQFENMLQAKANGAWNFHQIFSQDTLDIFVVFSSAAGILGSVGQSNYAAANSFLDTLMQYRRKQHLAGLSINWGSIAEIGLAAQQDNRGARLIVSGVQPIQQKDLFQYFDKLFLSDVAQIMAIEIDFEKWASNNIAVYSNYFYESFVKQKTKEESISDPASFPNHAAAVKYVKQRIKNCIATVTKMNIQKIKEDDTFKSYGIDSLMALQIKNNLQNELNIMLNVSVIWSQPTVNKLAEFIAKDLSVEADNKAEEIPPIAVSLTSIENEVENLSLDELIKQLNEKINN